MFLVLHLLLAVYFSFFGEHSCLCSLWDECQVFGVIPFRFPCLFLYRKWAVESLVDCDSS